MITQFFNAFNDNLYKTAMTFFVVWSVYNSEQEEALFSGVGSLIFVLPFVLFSALAGQLADTRDKAAIIRIVKLCEIGWASLGVLGLYLVWQGIAIHTVAIPLLLVVLFLASTQSAFLGPIKYAILPQQLKEEEVLSGTGLVEAGTYIAILGGTILAGFVEIQNAMWVIMLTAFVGYFSARFVPEAPPQSDYEMHFPLLEPFAAKTKSAVKRWLGYPFVAIADQAVMSYRLVKDVRQNRPIWLAIVAISFFWTMGAVLFIQFPPLAKNQFLATPEVSSLFLVIFSLGIALGSVSINMALKGVVSARFSPASVVVMGAFLLGFYLVAKSWTANPAGELMPIEEWILEPLAIPLSLMLLGVSTAGGMFVVPLYAFLTTKCAKDAASRTIAVNNIVNCISMVLGSAFAIGLTSIGIPVVDQLLVAAAMTVVSAYLGWMLYKAEKEAADEEASLSAL